MVVWLSGLVCPGNLSQSGAPGSVHMGNSTSRKTSRNYNCDKLYISKHGRAREEKIESCQLCVLYRDQDLSSCGGGIGRLEIRW